MKNQFILLISLFFCVNAFAQNEVETVTLQFIEKMVKKAKFKKEEGYYNPPVTKINNHAQGSHNGNFSEPIDYYNYRLNNRFFFEVTHYASDTLNFQIMVYNRGKYRLVQSHIIYTGNDLLGISVTAIPKRKNCDCCGREMSFNFCYDPNGVGVWTQKVISIDTVHGYQDREEGYKHPTSPSELALKIEPILLN